jgi:hypothetical protein
MSDEINVSVTEDHIKRGIKEDCDKCAIALAVLDAVEYRSLATGPIVRVFDPNEIEVYGKRYSVVVDYHMVKSFISNFDSGNNVEPISFTIKPYQVDEIEF